MKQDVPGVTRKGNLKHFPEGQIVSAWVSMQAFFKGRVRFEKCAT